MYIYIYIYTYYIYIYIYTHITYIHIYIYIYISLTRDVMHHRADRTMAMVATVRDASALSVLSLC